jgi:Flp pilus assembly protein TadG
MISERQKNCKCRSISRRSKGQAAVEFAMSVSGLLLLILAITNFAMAVYAYNFVCYGARDATRYAAVRGSASPTPVSSSDVTAFVDSEATGLDPSRLTVSTTWSPNNQPSSTVAVQVNYNFQFMVPFVQLAAVNLSSTSQLVISQ